VDYVLLDENEQELLPCVAYRDSRTQAVMEEVYGILPKEALFARTGIAEQPFNTIFQLYCDKKSGKLARAAHFLMLPDYFGWRLTGVMKNEYTIASTSGLVNAEKRQWDEGILDALGLPKQLFLPLSQPGEGLGCFTEAVRQAVGFDAEVVLAPGHDTASAVLACPMGENSLYISSGTWSLLGMETLRPVTTAESMAAGITNEGGTHGRYRFLKNIMGMWLFQSIRKELNKRYTYDEMMYMAQESTYAGTFDPTDASILAPESMLSAIRALLGDDALPLGDVLAAVYHSLAQSYKRTVQQMENISGQSVAAIHIVGGGSRDRYLNALTAKTVGVPVIAGPTECTAEGNLLAQLMYADPALTLADARALIARPHEAEMHTYQ
jgi:rhamnulokinase